MPWQRPCPICRKPMEKQAPEDPWNCRHCGWASNEETRKKIYGAKHD